MENELALFGGKPLISRKLEPYKTIVEQDFKKVEQILKSGNLSNFLGTKGNNFLGGEYVNKFEKLASEVFQVDHVVTFNSWTSGLVAMTGAIELEPGDEVILTPWTMSATAMSIIQWGAIPVFVDISPENFCIDPSLIEDRITPKTKAILTVDIFGHPSNYKELRKICDKWNLLLLGDSAQAPNAKYFGKHVGGLSDIGGYSLNYHKHIQCGEGGFAVTNNHEFAKRLQLIRNHGESVISKLDNWSKKGIYGFNFRLGEIESALAYSQIERIDKLVSSRVSAAKILHLELEKFPGIIFPKSVKSEDNVFYILPIILGEEIREKRSLIVSALKAEGVPSLIEGYTNIHLLPIFSEVAVNPSSGFPWVNASENAKETYKVGACPIAEEFYNSSFIGLHMCSENFDRNDIKLIVQAFEKVWRKLGLILR
jgi:perosamine synthetase